MSYFFYLLLVGLIAGQLIKFPSSTTGGLTILDLSVFLVTLISLINLRFRLKKPPLFLKTALIFITITLISLIFTPLHLTATEYLNSFAYTVRFTLYILLAWTFYSGAFPNFKKYAPWLFLYTGLSLSILGFFQLIIFPDFSFLQVQGWDPHYLRLVSTLLDPNFLGGFLTLTFLTSLTTSLTPGRCTRDDTFRKVTLAIIYLAILLTFSRSAYLAFGVSLFTLSLLQKSSRMVLLTILLICGLGLGYFGYQKGVVGPRNINKQQSAQYRIDNWQTGWEMFTKSPVLGVGFNSYRYALIEYNLAPTEFTQSRGASANDSSLLFILTTTGIVGFMAYLFFLGNLFRQNRLLLAGLAGILAQSFFINSLFYPWILLWVVLISVRGGGVVEPD